MSLLIKNWQMADWKELLKWAKIGLNNAMIGEFAEVEELPPHGRLIDADEFLKNAQLQRCFRGDYALLLNDVIEECITIIPAEEGET